MFFCNEATEKGGTTLSGLLRAVAHRLVAEVDVPGRFQYFPEDHLMVAEADKGRLDDIKEGNRIMANKTLN